MCISNFVCCSNKYTCSKAICACAYYNIQNVHYPTQEYRNHYYNVLIKNKREEIINLKDLASSMYTETGVYFAKGPKFVQMFKFF